MTYYVGAGCTGSDDFHDLTDWWNYLDAFARRLESPLVVEMETDRR